MIARAPGKVVLSGAYAVLEGAPALVAAVDRYVVADTAREAERITAEVETALAQRAASGTSGVRAPWFDARALRDETRDQKLGLGSSAAILVASLAALAARDPREAGTGATEGDAALATHVFGPALLAHRTAQRGGSGIDVAASTFGGILSFRRAAREGELPSHHAVTLPAGLHVEVWSCRTQASTADMIARVGALRETRTADLRRVLTRLGDASISARDAKDALAFVDACREQLAGLSELGELAHTPIVTDEIRVFADLVAPRGEIVFPSGAGGGDVVLWVSTKPSDAEVDALGRRAGLVPLSLSLGARGVHFVGAAALSSSKATS